MKAVKANDILFHVRKDGDPSGVPVVFANSLGSDLRLWDDIIPLLPDGFCFIRFDKRGHGLSECPNGPYKIEDLASDAEHLIEALGFRSVIFVGLSIGGLIGQMLASKRPDLIKAMVLSNTGAKIGTKEMWEERMEAIRKGGMKAVSSGIIGRWFAPTFHSLPEAGCWQRMLEQTTAEGYLSCSSAILHADLHDQTATLRLPVLGIAGDQDLSTPADLVKATVDLIPGAGFQCISGTGHLPCVEKPEIYADLLGAFLKEHASG